MNSVALEEVGEVGRPEHDGEDVGLVGLEELDEPRRERRAGLAQPALEPDEPRALGAQLGPRGSRARRAWRRGRAWRTSSRPASVVIFAWRRLILRVYCAMSLDSVFSAPFLRPIWPRVRSIFPLQLVELAPGRGCGGRPEGQGRPEGDGDRDAHDEDDGRRIGVARRLRETHDAARQGVACAPSPPQELQDALTLPAYTRAMAQSQGGAPRRYRAPGPDVDHGVPARRPVRRADRRALRQRCVCA